MSKDLSQILYTIIKTRFLILISKITIDYNNILKGLTNSYFGKILITDDSSRALLSNIIDMKCLKRDPIGICCEYNLRDVFPEEFKRRYHLIYLIGLNEMSDEEYDLFHNHLLIKSSESQTVFSFYNVLSSGKRFKKLQHLRQFSSITAFFRLGGFQCIDHNIVVIDNSLNTNWFLKTDDKSNQTNAELIEKLVKRLVNFLEQIGEFPTVFRYFDSKSHKMNKSITKLVYEEMKKIADQRKASKETKHENNYQLLIIDRTVDLITPLIQCLQFRPFVYNELEKQYENDMNSEYRKLNTISVDNTSQINETFKRINESLSDHNGRYEVLIEKTKTNIENASEIFKKN